MLSPIKTNLGEKLKDKAYRVKFFRGRVQDDIAYHLKAARRKRVLTQPELEQLSGMKQSAISRLEQASYSRWNIQSLLRLADALDLRVRVCFDYAEDVIKEYVQMESGIATSEFERYSQEIGMTDQSIEWASLPPGTYSQRMVVIQ